MHADTLLLDAVLLLAIAVAVVFACARVRIPPIVGLVGAGMLVGPSGLALVPDPEEVELAQATREPVTSLAQGVGVGEVAEEHGDHAGTSR